MNTSKMLMITASLLAVSSTYGIEYANGEWEYTLTGLFKPETQYGVNVSLINNLVPEDSIIYFRHTLDLGAGVSYGHQTFNKPIIDSFFALRNRGMWGNPSAIMSTTFSDVKVLDAITGSHNHAIPRHVFWIREGWVQFDVGEMLNFPMGYDYTFTLGAFSFELGRGIALGDAYAVGSDLLGFYSDSLVDQYAFGAKLSGSILPKTLTYDLYAAILQNNSGNLYDTNSKVYAQALGRIDTPKRGFGHINFVVAGHMFWNIFESEKYGKLQLEPYAMYNSDPEQQIEFVADAESKLATLGVAGTYSSDRIELGFDYALNLGYQRVLGWDRNQIELQNRNGTVVLANSHVAVGSAAGDSVLFTGSSSDDQRAINDTSESARQNGKLIATTATGELFNTSDRFRNSYVNKYEGWMFVADAAVYFFDKDLRVGIEGGIATGDENPNFETIDGNYTGFISLQEQYSGRLVQSAFLLGGAGRLKRPLSRQLSDLSEGGDFAPTIEGFSNLVYGGVSAKWQPKSWEKSLNINPNILAYWQQKASRAYDAQARKELDCLASRFLGIETNIFADYYIYKNLKVYCIASIFFPGDHYRDIRGKPLNSEQQRALDVLDSTAFEKDRIPNIGADKAYTLNIGLEFRF